MEIVLDIEVAPFLIAASAIFSVLHYTVEHFLGRAEDTFRVTAVKKGKSWRGFLNPRYSGRLEELFKSRGRIKSAWIAAAVILAMGSFSASYAGELGISTRIEDRVRGTIVAHSQFGNPMERTASACQSPRTCEPLQNYLQALIRSGDFTQIDFRSSGIGSVTTYGADETRTLPPMESEDAASTMRATFQACLQFRSVAVNTEYTSEQHAVIAESCGSIENKHTIEVFMAEPAISEFEIYHPGGENASYWGWFSHLEGNATYVRTASPFRQVIARGVSRMDLSHYLKRDLPNLCEVSNTGNVEGSLGFFVFVCPLDGFDFYIGSLQEQATYPQDLMLNAFRLQCNATDLSLRWEDVLDAIVSMSSAFMNSGLTEIEGSLFAVRSFVYGVMMSTYPSEVRTMKPVVLVVVSAGWIIFAASLLLLPLFVLIVVSYTNSLTLPSGVRRKKLDIPISASQVHKAAVTALNPYLEETNTWKDHHFALYDPGSPSNKLRLGWTSEPCPLGNREVSKL